MTKKRVKGINRIAFASYYNLPGLIAIRMFNYLDKTNSNHLTAKEFISGMVSLFADSLDVLIDFVFEFYDFNNDGKISKEDIKSILIYIPRVYNFDDLMALENELFEMLNNTFKDTNYLNKKTFYNKIMNEDGLTIFLPLVIFLYENKPFTNEEIENIYERKKDENNDIDKNLVFFDAIDKNQNKQSSIFLFKKKDDDSVFDKLYKTDKIPIIRKHSYLKFPTNLYKCPNIYENSPRQRNRFNSAKQKQSFSKLISYISNEDNENLNNIKYILYTGKLDKLFKAVPYLFSQSKLFEINNLINTEINENSLQNLKRNRKRQTVRNYHKNKLQIISEDNRQVDKNKESNKNNLNKMNIINQVNDFFESYLYKLTKKKKTLKLMFFRLINSNLFAYKTRSSKYYKNIHILKGAYLEYDLSENNTTATEDSIPVYSFSLVYSNQIKHTYYSDNLQLITKWIKKLKEILHYENIFDKYTLGKEIGKGKFSNVFEATNKITGEKVAIKLIKKKEITPKNLEFIKTEIDILKICHHPYVIKLYDSYEYVDKIYIVLELCQGGNLYDYLMKHDFDLLEKDVCRIIYKLATALYTMHSLGIVHRDLKLTNIALIKEDSVEELKIIDFGLSTIMGPTEKATDPYGTIGYSAPEVMTSTPYDNKIDVFSLGVICYFLVCGEMPFSNQIENSSSNNYKEIINKTIKCEMIYSDVKDIISKECIDFFKSTIVKNPQNRLNIRQVLEHPWFNKFIVGNKKKTSIEYKKLKKNYFEVYSK